MEPTKEPTKVYVLSIDVVTALGMMSCPVEVWSKAEDAKWAASARNPNEFTQWVLSKDSDVPVLQSLWRLTEVNLDAKHTRLQETEEL